MDFPISLNGSELPVQSTARGRAYAKWRNAIKDIRDSRDPKERALYERVRDSLIRDLGLTVENGRIVQASVQPTSVHTNKFMSELSRKYANDMYIADRLMPILEVGKRSDDFATYDERRQLNAPDDETSPEGDVNEVERARGSDNYSVKDYALKDKVSQSTLDNQDDVFDEMFDLVEDLTDSMLLKMEQRIAAIVFAAGSFASGQTHSPSTKWDAASSTIVSDLLTATSEVWRGSGRTRLIGVCGIAVWNVIANNAEIKALFNNVREGLATTEAVARYFGIDDILVGRARQETANLGQTASYSRIWSTDNFAILSVAERPTRRSAHFGTTFQFGPRTQTQWTDPSKGPSTGVLYSKIGMSQDHKVVANKAGYILTDVLT